MTDRDYSDLLTYARLCLPKTAFSEPGDLVSQAYLEVRSNDKGELKQRIKYIAVSEKGYTSGFVSFEKKNFKDNSIKETTRVCKVCQLEKSIDSFAEDQNASRPTAHRRLTCKGCVGKANRKTLKRDNEKYEAFKAKDRDRLRKLQEAKTGQKSKVWEAVLLRIKDKIDADDWRQLLEKLAEGELAPEWMKSEIKATPPRQWLGKEIDYLYEAHQTATLQQMAAHLKRTKQDVAEMMANFGFKTGT
ncbi:hypothetical protein IC229_27490 [Spirosoma sp. BT702]|uniref:Uncharacterized protein n=1 Tax=Spirosoma profusum TaxID=2771354 RepID=A0A927ATU2_9BACT|nr:hypothetical protein [Spirosoma profusum]MBD2704415.1 hypothetical protein [Spirosoma profusum]